MKICFMILLLMATHLTKAQIPSWLIGCWEQKTVVEGERHLYKIEFAKDSSVFESSIRGNPIDSTIIIGRIETIVSEKFLIHRQFWRINGIDFSNEAGDLSEWSSISKKGSHRIRIVTVSTNRYTGENNEDKLILKRCAALQHPRKR